MWEKMQRWVEQLHALDPTDDVERFRLHTQIFEALMREVPQHRDALGTFYEKEFSHYDPAKGAFKSFVLYRLKKQDGKVKKKDNGTHDYRNKEVNNVSLETPIGDGAQGSLGDLLEDTNAADLDKDIYLEQISYQLLAAILQLPERLRGKANNPERIHYFRLFFTDGAAASIAEMGAAHFRAHERELFETIVLSFLDFFMAECCRTAEKIACTALKNYGAMVEGRPMNEPKQPLPNDVYITYLETQEGRSVRDSAISNQRAAYKCFLREQLC